MINHPYIIHKLDEINVDEIRNDIRRSMRRGLIDQDSEEVSYRTKLTYRSTVEEFVRERKEVYEKYDNACISLVPLLIELEDASPRERILKLSKPLNDLFVLDGKRRGIGAVYNDPGSIGMRIQENILNIMDKLKVHKNLQGILLQTILLPDIAYDVAFQRDTWKLLKNMNNTTDPEEYFMFNAKEQAETYCRGSIGTYFRRIKPLLPHAYLAAKFVEKIDKGIQKSIDLRGEAMAALSKEQLQELEPSLLLLHQLARFNCIEDLQRRSCLDQFEEYLLRKMVAEALCNLGYISDKDPFAINQKNLCTITLEVAKFVE